MDEKIEIITRLLGYFERKGLYAVAGLISAVGGYFAFVNSSPPAVLPWYQNGDYIIWIVVSFFGMIVLGKTLEGTLILLTDVLRWRNRRILRKVIRTLPYAEKYLLRTLFNSPTQSITLEAGNLTEQSRAMLHLMESIGLIRKSPPGGEEILVVLTPEAVEHISWDVKMLD